MRKALIVGINNYPTAPLYGCIKDATAVATMLEKDGNGDPNFDVRLLTDVKTRSELGTQISELFSGQNELSLLYFSGHGYSTKVGTYLVTPDAQNMDVGVSMDELLVLANEDKATNRVIILDCCHAGAAGTSQVTGGMAATLHKGLTILASSKEDEASMEVNGHGLFTNLLLNALSGGAADIRGDITPGGVYAYIDQALGSWDQRPVFKSNIKEFVCLRKITPRVPKEILRKIVEYFPSQEEEFQLDPSYEFTNSKEELHQLKEPFADKNNVEVFKNLQKFHSVGLVVPVDADHMYFAAMNSKSCKLTALGYHYWRLVNKNKI